MDAVERFFAPDLPAAQGHFPGNPIIPGALLLSETLKAIEDHLGVSLAPGEIKAAKFLYPARPGDLVRIEFTRGPTRSIRFTCTAGQKTILTGVVACVSAVAPG